MKRKGVQKLNQISCYEKINVLFAISNKPVDMYIS